MEDYKKTIWQITTDAWKFFKEHLPTPDNDDYWEEVVRYYTDLPKPYKDTPAYKFATETALVYLNELQRYYRRMKENEQ